VRYPVRFIAGRKRASLGDCMIAIRTIVLGHRAASNPLVEGVTSSFRGTVIALSFFSCQVGGASRTIASIEIPVAFLNLPGELSIGAVRVLILARMRRASASCPRRGFFGLRPVATKFRPPYRPGAGEDTRTVVMNEAGGFDDVNLLKALGAEALGAPAFDEDGPNEGNDVREPKLVVFSGGTAFNSVAAGTLWWCGMVLLISTEPRSTCTHVISQLAL